MVPTVAKIIQVEGLVPNLLKKMREGVFCGVNKGMAAMDYMHGVNSRTLLEESLSQYTTNMGAVAVSLYLSRDSSRTPTGPYNAPSLVSQSVK
jgi:hypothetical protein